MTHSSPISEEELHAYLDGELAEERRRAVEAYLDAHPDEARRLDAYRADGEAIARIFSGVGTVPKRRRLGVRWWAAAAAAVLIFLAGAAAGWFGHERGRTGDSELRALAERAATAHAILSAPGPKSLEITSPHDVAASLEQVLGRAIDFDRLTGTGFVLTGARVLQAPKGRSVQLTFRSSEWDMFTFFVVARPGAMRTPWIAFQQDGITTVAWEENELACAVSGSLLPDKMKTVSHKLYDALIAHD